MSLKHWTLRRRLIVTVLTFAGLACDATGPVAHRATAVPPAAPLPAALYDGYSATSPHWPHVRVSAADYRITYLADPVARAAEYDWAAAHFDRVILDTDDPRSVPEYATRNLPGRVYRYALNWTVVQPGQQPEGTGQAYYTHMQRWYAAHPAYDIERAFIHDASLCPPGTVASESCRMTVSIWATKRWCLNPGDPGLRAYQLGRFTEIAADVQGLFIDEQGSGDISDRIGGKGLREYPLWDGYQRDLVSLLDAARSGSGGRHLLINTSAYTSSWDVQMITAAGGTHAELLNDPFHGAAESRWSFVESLLAQGADVQMVSGGTLPANYPAGNSPSPEGRRKLWELASYYLVVPPVPDALALDIGLGWSAPYRTHWLAAVEADIGHPWSARALAAQGTDPAGQPYHVWARDFDRALVLVRPVVGWLAPTFDDGTAVAVPLPGGESYLPLASDGTVGGPVSSIPLRNSEAAILIKERTISR